MRGRMLTGKNGVKTAFNLFHWIKQVHVFIKCREVRTKQDICTLRNETELKYPEL